MRKVVDLSAVLSELTACVATKCDWFGGEDVGALAENTGTALQLATRLIAEKLSSQEKVARERLHNISIADDIANFRSSLRSADRLEAVLSIEANAALAYWSAWSKLPIQYPLADLRRVSDHWQVFGARVSPLTGSPRLACRACLEPLET